MQIIRERGSYIWNCDKKPKFRKYEGPLLSNKDLKKYKVSKKRMFEINKRLVEYGCI